MDDYISRQQAIDALHMHLMYRMGTDSNKRRLDDWINGVPSVQPEQQWIPVGERLPDEYGEYLVTKRTFGWNCEEYVSNDIAYFDNDGFHKADTVIAWKPLPEPYKAESEK